MIDIVAIDVGAARKVDIAAIRREISFNDRVVFCASQMVDAGHMDGDKLDSLVLPDGMSEAVPNKSLTRIIPALELAYQQRYVVNLKVITDSVLIDIDEFVDLLVEKSAERERQGLIDRDDRLPVVRVSFVLIGHDREDVPNHIRAPVEARGGKFRRLPTDARDALAYVRSLSQCLDEARDIESMASGAKYDAAKEEARRLDSTVTSVRRIAALAIEDDLGMSLSDIRRIGII